MKPRIAIEENLTPIEEFLSEKGYEVENIDFTDAEEISSLIDEFDAFVVTGLDTNMLGIDDVETDAIIIDAAGMTPEQVYDELEARLE
ncbi:MAG TPA: YkuS family protein [Acetivibrio sp.]|uniref:YkuS family protein n=1 Tax=Acetivibrio sp. TaxID=1872092 RepID=UPI002CA1B835|nr:YkuS family protein [Acetivibrio sp.]HOM01821.1 YkuS family protein [Acetivibrio sp.]